MQTLTKRARNKMLENQMVIGGLVGLFGKHQTTIERWIGANDIRLTLPASLQIIRINTGLTDAEILEESTETQRA